MERRGDVGGSGIAVIGMACRFPGAPTLEKFWENLREGRDAVTFFGEEELLAAGASPELVRDARYVKAGQILSDVDLFDTDFFKITRDEAEILDPQQRLFLECAVEAFEHAGYDPGSFPGAVGVYAGVGLNTYLLCNLAERYRTATPIDRYRLMLGNDKDFLATRVSYKLDLRGPSVNVSTACSTSLVAVHLACLSLMSGECDMALVGCGHVKVPQLEGYLFQDGLIFSPDGRCRAFDARAQGTILGSGVGVVILKRLADALEERDWIHAVIKGSSINNDGGAKASYTAPDVDGQAAVIAEAQALAGCDADTISYVEAHGTGTRLGDPIELAALARAFAPPHTGAARCAIGSVKTNVGHLDVAAGMAGLIKTCLMLDRRWLVPSLHFETLNPEIDLAGTPFYVNTKSTSWEIDEGSVRRAGVSSFGIGGTNAHVVLEEAPAQDVQPSQHTQHVLVVSARSAKTLEKAADDLARHLTQHPEHALSDVAYTLAMRKAYSYRAALVARDHRDAALTLTLGDGARVQNGHAHDATPEVVFAFQDTVNNADVARLCDVLPALRSIVNGLCEDIRGALPAFIAQYALAQLWCSWNIRPAALVARGSGVLAAGCVAGCLRPSDAVAMERAGADDGTCRAARVAPSIPIWWDVTRTWWRPGEAIDRAVWTRAGRAASDARVLAPPDDRNRITVALDFKSEAVLATIARLWAAGAPIDWVAYYGRDRRGRVPLPARRFERKRYWINAPDRSASGDRRDDVSLRHRLDGADDRVNTRVLVELIQREIARILGTADLPNAESNLFDLGIDSLTLIEVAAKLTDELERPVSPAAFVDHFTIRSFAMNLAGTLSGRPALSETPAAHAGT